MIWSTGFDEFIVNQSVKWHVQRPLEGQVLKVMKWHMELELQ